MSESQSGEELRAVKEKRGHRSTAKGCLTRKCNELKSHLSSGVTDIQIITDGREAVEKALREFKSAHETYKGLLREEDELEEAEAYMESVVKATSVVLEESKARLQDLSSVPVVEPKDSVSQAGSAAGSSSLSGARLHVAAKRAALEARAAALEKQKAIELAELELKQRREKVQLEMEIAIAAAEEAVYTYAKSEVASGSAEKQEDILDSHSEIEVTSKVGNSKLNPHAKDWVPKNAEEPVAELIHRGQQQQQQLLEAVHLPRAEMVTFDGDPLQYWLFMRSFEVNVENTSLNDGAKLTRLLQSCKGEASRVVKCCAVMKPSEGYKRALQLLKERFGNEYQISEAWVKKITSGGRISANDKQSLQEFGDDLKACHETLCSMGYESELNNQRILVQIVEHLPNFLIVRWRRETRLIRKSRNRSPFIADLVTFVLDAAEELNDPIFGDLSMKDKNKGLGGSTGYMSRSRGKGSSFNVVTDNSSKNGMIA